MAPLPKIDTKDFEHILQKTREKLAVQPDAHEPENHIAGVFVVFQIS